ncbi:MAG TPA: hypothetical protein DCF68_11885, partial [Cyanothece sp. UBA12306]|nr:hypothetical protein [Cyanothece sp. UBA12306]
WEAIQVTGEGKTWEQWKRELVKIAPVWDFSGYNSITTQPINDVMENYTDNSHYTEKVGNLVLNRIFSYQLDQVPDDFGVLITPENIDNHLKKINQKRKQWLENNQNEEQLVKTLKRNFDQQQKSKSE